MNDELVPLRVIMEEFSVTRQCLCMAIRNKRLKAYMYDGIYMTTRANYRRYVKGRFGRNHSSHEGEKVYDNNFGRYSLKQAANLLRVDYGKLYYATQIGDLKTYKLGNFIVVDIDELRRFSENVLKKRRVLR